MCLHSSCQGMIIGMRKDMHFSITQLRTDARV